MPTPSPRINLQQYFSQSMVSAIQAVRDGRVEAGDIFKQDESSNGTWMWILRLAGLLVVIAVAWLFYRPMLSVALLCVAAAVVYFV